MTSAREQYQAAHERVILMDQSDREHLELTGRDRAAFLHNFCTQEIKKLPAGSGAEAFVTNIKGKLLGHVLVFVGADAIWLDGPPGTAGKLIPHLDRYLITEDVQITDRSADWSEVGLIGPLAGGLVESLVPGSGAFQMFQHGSFDGVTVRRFDFTRQPGWLLGTARSGLPELTQRLLAAGAEACAAATWDALRIESGFPVYGIDLTEDHLAHESGRKAQAISFTKGCYLGQEPIARLESLGHTNRELRAVRLETAAVPRGGAVVVTLEGGAECGVVSSAALSPAAEVGVALAMLRREVCQPGTKVGVRAAEGTVTAIVLDTSPGGGG